MSPEGLSHAMLSYVDSLYHQVETAKAFFIGNLIEGLEKLKTLPEQTQQRILQLTGEDAPPDVMASAILRQLEERLGIC